MKCLLCIVIGHKTLTYTWKYKNNNAIESFFCSRCFAKLEFDADKVKSLIAVK